MSTQTVSRINRLTAVEEPRPFTAGEYIMRLCNPSGGEPPWENSPLRGFLGGAPKMANALISTTRLASMVAAPSIDVLAEWYLHDWSVLTKSAEQTRAFLFAIIDSQMSVTGPPTSTADITLPRAMADARQDLCKSLMIGDLGGGGSVLTAQLCAKPLNEAFAHCKEDITKRANDLATEIFKELVLGAARGTFGYCDWTSPSTCSYVRHEFEIRFTDTKIEQRDAMKLTVTRHFEKWRAANEVHLLRANQITGFPESFGWPAPLWAALSKMPPFLRSFVKTVAGTMIKKRIVKWKFGEGVHVSEIPKPVEVPLRAPHKDPAVCIGPIVLSGFDCLGIELHKKEPGWFARLMG